MSELTAKELEELKELLRATTPGPWKSMIEGRDHDSGDSFIMTGEGKTRGEDIYLTGASAADQDFVARARSDMSRLIAEIEKLRARLRGPAAAE